MDYQFSLLAEFSLEKIIYHLLGFICHQDQAILLRIDENLIPLCPRCLGLNIGFFSTLVFYKLLFKSPFNLYKPSNILVLFLSISLAGFHWFLGFLSVIEINNSLRILTGLISGSGFCVLLISLKHKHSYSDFKITAWNKIIIVLLLALLLSFSFLSNYIFLLVSILLLVISNIISIILSIWIIIRHNKILNDSFKLKKEMQL